MSRLKSHLSSPLLPLALLGSVPLLDAALRAVPPRVAVIGALDEPAHLATAAVLLLACGPRHPSPGTRRLLTITLCASVLIDLDHLALYAGLPHVDSGGRPYSHAPATVLLLGASAAASRRHRATLAGAALGVALHLFRDFGTGPGITLLWPASTANVRVPYWTYLATLSATAVIASTRGARSRRQPAERSPTLQTRSGAALSPER